MKSLASDNYSSVSPEIFEYLAKEVNLCHARAYGFDEITAKSKDVIRKAFNTPESQINFVMTGTGANVLCIRHCLRSTQSVFVAETSHFNANETGAPEATGHTKLISIPVLNGKIILEEAERIILQENDNVPHTPRPGMLSIAQSTEYGTVYTLEELAKISEFCKKYNILFHMDLCRVYNAAVSLNVTLSEIIKTASPDIVSLGGSKNGLMFAEAVIIFNKSLQSEEFVLLQKQNMQLYSKMRYLSGQFIPFFETELWKKNATIANEMCSYLYNQIKDLNGVKITTPVQTNHIFLEIPKDAINPLQELSPFYVWTVATNEVRLVTSFDTTKDEIDAFVSKMKELINS